jgi:Flp pilus assembly protein TadG
LVTKRKKHKVVIKSRGQALVEFALVLPLLLLLVLGAMDLGRVITTKMVMTNAAREGANFLSRNSASDPYPFSATKAIIEAYCANQNIPIDTENGIVITTEEPETLTKVTAVTVTVSKDVDLIYGGILQALGFFSGPVQVGSEVQMRVQ